MRLWEVVADGALCGHTAIFATPLRLVSFTPINLVFYFWYKPRCKRGTKVKGYSNLQVACTNNGSWPRENMMTVTGKIFKLGTSLKIKMRIQSLRSTPCQLGKIYVVLYTSHLNHYGRLSDRHTSKLCNSPSVSYQSIYQIIVWPAEQVK